MSRWRSRATERLRSGEEIEAAIPFGDNGVVLTNQRLLAFMPDGDGSNFRAVERPNVEGATLTHVGDVGWFEYVLKGGLFGIAGVALGLTVDFGGLISFEGITTGGAGADGMGSILSILAGIKRLLAQLDDALLVGGLLGIALALGALGKYIESRTHDLVVDVAGQDDLHVKAPTDADDEAAQLRRLLRTEDLDADAEPPEDPLAQPE